MTSLLFSTISLKGEDSMNVENTTLIFICFLSVGLLILGYCVSRDCGIGNQKVAKAIVWVPTAAAVITMITMYITTL